MREADEGGGYEGGSGKMWCVKWLSREATDVHARSLS